MIIERIINNNVISSRNQDGKEIVIMGNGIGFGKKKGESVDEAQIDKIFHIEDGTALARFQNLLANLPLEYIQVSNEIISYAKCELGARLNENVYITLTDHISFALERFQKGMLFPNALHSEIRRFYTTEYAIGLHALAMIEEKTKIRLPDDEAASIALHLVNAEFDLKVRDTWAMTNMLVTAEEALCKWVPSLRLESLQRDRIMSELKFIVYRMHALLPVKEKGDDELWAFLSENAPLAIQAASGAAEALEAAYKCTMTQEEELYLALCLKRLIDLYGSGQER